MKNKSTILTVFLALLATTSSLAIARPAPSHTVSVDVRNTCNMPITFHLDNNIGSQQTGDYTLATAGTQAKNDGKPSDTAGFFFNSNNDEEFYTISYKGATCKVDYPLIRDRWTLTAVISNCSSRPACNLR